jgi:LPS export ABC transporter protein LptC
VRRLSTLCLICFVAIVAGLGGVIAWKVVGRRTPAPPPSAPQQADYQIKEIHINETLEGNLRWTLDAAQAEVFDKTQQTVMRQVVIHVFSKDGKWSVTGDEGTLDNDKRDVSLRGNVVVTSSDGLQMRTPELSWRNQDRTLSTEAAVEIQRPGTTIVGRGLEIQLQEERAVLQRDVRVVISNRANANLALFPRSGS